MTERPPSIAPLASAYADREIVVSFSGGKDSGAVCLALREAGYSFRMVYQDTGWESSQTYRYLREYWRDKVGEVEEIRADLPLPEGFEDDVREIEKVLGHPSDMVRACVRKLILPRRTARWCTDTLKHGVFQKWAAARPPFVNAVGIRADESKARASYPAEEPAFWLPEGDTSIWVWRPILRWSVADVVAIHRRHGVSMNPLYYEEAQRVGCWPCVMSRKAEIRQIARDDPARIRAVAMLEALIQRVRRETGRSPPDYRAGWFMNPRPRRDPETRRTLPGEAVGWPIADIVKWANTTRGGDPELDVVIEAESGCMRWGMCDLPKPASMTERPPVWAYEGKHCPRVIEGECHGNMRAVELGERCSCGARKRNACGCPAEGYAKCDVCGALRQIWPIEVIDAPRVWEDASTDSGEKRDTTRRRPRRKKMGRAPTIDYPYVSRVRTNAKIGADVEIGPKTLIIGANGTGKTTIATGLSLALSGFAPDLAGKASETRASYAARLLGSGDDPLFAEATVRAADASTRTYTWQSTRDAAVTHLDPADVFPVSGLRAILATTGDKRRAWLADVAARHLPKGAVETAAAELPPKRWARLAARLDGDTRPALRAVGELADALAKEASAATREASATEKQIAGMGAVGTSAPNPARLEEIHAELAGLGDTVAGAVTEEQRAAARAELAAVSAQIADVETQGAKATETIAQYDAWLATQPTPQRPDAATAERLRVMLAGLELQAGTPGDVCVFCGHAAGEPHLHGTARTTADQIRAILDPPDPAAQARKDRAAWDAHRESLRTRWTQLCARRNQLQATADAPAAGGDPARRAALLAEADRLSRAAGQGDALARLRTQRNEAQERAAALKLDRAAAVRLRDDLLGMAIDAWRAAVDQYLPADERIHVDLAGTHADLGVVIDGTVRLAPSGAEEARLLLAIGAATAQTVDHPVILVPDERQWAPDTLASVMRALADAPCQVVLTSTVRPKGKVAASVWTVVQTDDGTGDPDGLRESMDAADAADPVDTPAAVAPALPSTTFPTGTPAEARACVGPYLVPIAVWPDAFARYGEGTEPAEVECPHCTAPLLVSELDVPRGPCTLTGDCPTCGWGVVVHAGAVFARWCAADAVTRAADDAGEPYVTCPVEFHAVGG